MKREAEREVLGVVGGLGPMASAEFLKTVYEYGIGEDEQDAPIVLLHSDPTFPDRTDSFLAGESQLLLARLTEALQRLSDAGASRFVICCMTIHYLLPSLPVHLGARVVSLLDVIFENLKPPQRHLLICSNGTRRLELFQNHPQWDRHKSEIVLPDDDDQNKIHRELIYPIKKRPDFRRLKLLLETLLQRYEVDSFIAGCSEIHVLAKHADGYGCLDPLTIIARNDGEHRRAYPQVKQNKKS
ncbi:MAG TPA: aspartate/glutamate racemase family protein [Pyrinomonadaceae bacterium]|nr:aspartate/glutamate racemase family protein [Pyrinomonadaceae bacterium]